MVAEAALQRFSYERVFWKYAANLQKNSHAEVWLRHGCPLVNLLHIFRIPFHKNTYEGLLLQMSYTVEGWSVTLDLPSILFILCYSWDTLTIFYLFDSGFSLFPKLSSVLISLSWKSPSLTSSSSSLLCAARDVAQLLNDKFISSFVLEKYKI